MSTYSVLTSDLRRNPSILDGLVDTATRRSHNEADITITEHDGVTTVTAVTA